MPNLNSFHKNYNFDFKISHFAMTIHNYSSQAAIKMVHCLVKSLPQTVIWLSYQAVWPADVHFFNQILFKMGGNLNKFQNDMTLLFFYLIYHNKPVHQSAKKYKKSGSIARFPLTGIVVSTFKNLSCMSLHAISL